VKIDGRDFDGAIDDCKKVVAQFPEFAKAHEILANAYAAKGMHQQVIEEHKILDRLNGDKEGAERTAAFEQGYRAGGVKAGLARVMDVVKRQKNDGGLSSFAIANLYAQLGDKDQAFARLNTSFQKHEPELESMNTNYQLDPLKSDPRFAELMRKIGLPK